MNAPMPTEWEDLFDIAPMSADEVDLTGCDFLPDPYEMILNELDGV
jgi:hypothetical protein